MGRQTGKHQATALAARRGVSSRPDRPRDMTATAQHRTDTADARSRTDARSTESAEAIFAAPAVDAASASAIASPPRRGTPGEHLPTFTIRRLPAALGVALALVVATLSVPATALAHSPTVGASRGTFADVPDQAVGWRWAASTYPSWLTGSVSTALAGYRGGANNRGPAPAYASGASATVAYTAALASPCNSVTNLLWLACATNGGTGSFRIHVRDFDGAPYGDWRWWDKASTCVKSTGATASGCWLVARATIHEAGHAIPTFGHDTQTEAETVMRATSPGVGAVGGDTRTFRRCDVAALQLLWDLADLSGSYADCFDHVAGHGTVGLLTRLTTTSTAYRGCTGATATAAGRLATALDSRYAKLSDNPLGARTVWFDRKRRVDSTYTLRAESTSANVALSGSNWSRSFTSPTGTAGTWDYRAHFDGGTGLDPSAQVLFSITWGSTCQL